MGPGTIRCLAHSALPMLDEAVGKGKAGSQILSKQLKNPPQCLPRSSKARTRARTHAAPRPRLLVAFPSWYCR